MIHLNAQFKNFNEKFKFFYKYRFNKDYQRFSFKKKKISKKNSKIWLKKNKKELKIFKIIFKKEIIGMIYYNTKSFLYSIVINKKNRDKKIGIKALKFFFNTMKKKKKKKNNMKKKNNKK